MSAREMYTPTTGQVSDLFLLGALGVAESERQTLDNDVALAMFDRWLTRHDAEVKAAALEEAAKQSEPRCGCVVCNPGWWGMYICSLCGNKRCPHTENHLNDCTRSNEPGQVATRTATPEATE